MTVRLEDPEARLQHARDLAWRALNRRERTVTEMARAVGRPKSTVAYHVNQLVDAGLLKVVRTQKVRAIEERYYGRVARTIYIGALSSPEDMASFKTAFKKVMDAPALASADPKAARGPVGMGRSTFLS